MATLIRNGSPAIESSHLATGAPRLGQAVLHHIPLTSAYLCADCVNIGNCANQCPACGSKALLSLSAILNRSEQQEEARVPAPCLAAA